ncbi:MAG: hypothetical protein KF724_03070 [Phycisphaeraceae bacterium]|nr:hypothetical protein [Phycisphaeraceae bacterium]
MSHPPSTTSQSLTQLEPFDDPEPGWTWFFSLAGVIVLIALVVAIAALNFNIERKEFKAKVLDASAGIAALIPAGPLDAAGVRSVQAALDKVHVEGRLSPAEYARLSQGLLLNSWMRYPWINAEEKTETLVRIPIAEAMKLVSEEYSSSGKRSMASNADSAERIAAPGAPAPSNSGATEPVP